MKRVEKGPGFYITLKHGFHMVFANGYTVSVQWGPGNYCDNYDADYDKSAECGQRGSSTAECAVWAPGGDMIAWEDWGDTVGSRMTPADVLRLLTWAEAQEDNR